MNTSISAPDSMPPSAPGTLTATGGLGQVAPQLGRGDRQRRRRPLQRPPRHERRLHARRWRTGSRSRPGTSYTDSGLAAGTYYYKVTAEDVAGNVGPAGNEASARRPRPTRRRRRSSITAPARGATVSGTISDQRQRVRQRHGRRRPVQARRREPRRRGHQRSLLLRLGHVLRRATARTPLGAVARDAAGNTTTPRRTSSSPPRTPARRASSPPGRSTRRAGRRPPTSPATETSARSATRPV